MDRLLEDTLTPPRQLGADLTEAQEKALLRGLNIHPRQRFQSVQEMRTALYEGILGEADMPDVQAGTRQQGVQEEPGRQSVQEKTERQVIQEETGYQSTQEELYKSEELGAPGNRKN